MKQPFDFCSVRKDFPILGKKIHGKPLIYLDSAATGQKPKQVIDAIADFYQNHYGTVHRAVYGLSAYATKEYEKVRGKVRSFLNAASDQEVIFTRGTTDAINILAKSFGEAFIRAGDEICISEIEHHSNIIPWQMLCQRKNAHLKVVPVNDRAEIDMQKFSEALSEKTKLVAIAHISNATGTLHPIKQIISLAHGAGAKVFIDGAQSVPHQRIDVQALDADFFAFSGHKLYGPTGIGVLFGKKQLLDKMPPVQGGGDMLKTLDYPVSIYQELPLKFEAGTPMIAEVIGLGAAIDYLNAIGLPAIEQWENQLLDFAEKQFSLIEKEFGLMRIGRASKRGAILNFAVPGVHALDLASLLDVQGIAVRSGHHCSQGTMKRFGITSSVRASLAFYNTFEEINLFMKALREAIQTLRFA